MAREKAEREKKTTSFRWGLWLRLAGWALTLVPVAFAAREVQRFAVSNPHFRLPAAPPETNTPEFTVTGLRYGSRERVVNVFAPDFGHSVFSVRLEERRRRLLAVDWIEDASISRMWPNRLRIAVRERTPIAYVSLPQRRAGARVLLVDAQGVLLSRPPRAPFSFPVVTGLSEFESEESRAAKLAFFSKVDGEVRKTGQRISEIDLTSISALKITLAVDGRTLELILGDHNFGARTLSFLNHYPEIRRHSPGATVFDLRLDDRFTAKE